MAASVRSNIGVQWQQQCCTVSSQIESKRQRPECQFRTMLAQFIARVPDRSNLQTADQGIELVKSLVTEYSICLRMISAADIATNQPAKVVDDRAVEDIANLLVDVSYKVAQIVAGHVCTQCQQGNSASAVELLVSLINFDRECDPGYLLSTSTILVLPHYLKDTSAKPLFEELSPLVLKSPLSERFIAVLFRSMYRTRCYREISICEDYLTAENMSSSLAITILYSIMRQQSVQQPQTPNSKLERQKVSLSWKNIVSDNSSLYYKRAKRIVGILAQQDKRALGDIHLNALLSIELESILEFWRIPREIGLWLRWFKKYKVEPSVITFTAIIGAYCKHGDPAYAWYLFQRMVDGQMHVVYPDGTEETLQLPPPNHATINIAVQLWMQGHATEDIRQLLAQNEHTWKQISQQFITHILSLHVDRNEISKAEDIWINYGCHCAQMISSHKRPFNYRALTKLILGYAQSGNIEKAIAFFYTLCKHLRRTPKIRDEAIAKNLTIVYNAIVRCSLRSNVSWMLQPKKLKHRRGIDLLLLELAENVDFDITTYNVILARFSRIARVAVAQPDSLPELKQTAQLMNDLYQQMLREGIIPDVTTIVHLIPLWLYMGRMDLALNQWIMLNHSGRSKRSLSELKRHILAQAQNWNVVTKAQMLIDKSFNKM
ncbi:hypothetical protein IWW36_003177 [Coemansia brasiliensis]|uniref:Pentatricopeptide repeat-containing protein n=1 Tax=Coemansia brasiliensis TaxID=2650707 RepID=A0A9W8IEI5_9FUNG|nr:hypothetical protein IWW36_003177 [Coemansia brasiliensis]